MATNGTATLPVRRALTAPMALRWKLQRRGEWTRSLEPTLAMWEHVLDSLKRRYRRRGVGDEDVDQVERIVKDLRRQRDEEE